MARRRGRAAKNARRAQSGQSVVNKLAMGIKGPHAARRIRREERRLERRDAKKQPAVAAASSTPTDGRLPAKTPESDQLTQAPHSFVFHRGKVGKTVLRLVRDMRRVMEPYTASNLKVQKRNNLKDFVVNAAPMGVTHLMILSKTTNSVVLRLVKLPQGPTITFKVNEYSLSKDVVSKLRRPVVFQEQFNTQPLVVINSFPNDHQHKHLQLTQSMLQNMFPPIKVDSLDLRRVRRCALFNYDTDSGTIDFRHYAISNVASGVSRSLKKLMKQQSGKVPNLGRYDDISEFLLNMRVPRFSPGQLSESEAEIDKTEVEAPQDLLARGCHQGSKTSIRLTELGPRLTLEVIKIEEGISDGEVLYHAYVKKSPVEINALRQEQTKKRKLKEKRRQEQELNVVRKMQHREKLKQKCEEGVKRKLEARTEGYKHARKQQDSGDESETESKRVKTDKHTSSKSAKRRRKVA